MKIIFLTLYDIGSYAERNLYCDLLREFVREGHEVFCVSPSERRTGQPTRLLEDGHLLKVRIGNIQKTGMLEKGISTLLLEGTYKRAVKKYFSGIKFDLILYSTPPITLSGVVEYIRKRDNAATYLLLKDIFPQNAVDIGVMKKSGVTGILYRYFRRKEKHLYEISDRIGCMSPANVEYVKKHNPELSPAKLEVCPNSMEIEDKIMDPETRKSVREKYGLPLDRKIFVYGGNLGKPQGIPFLIECLEAAKRDDRVFFLIVGNGTEYGRLAEYVRASGTGSVKLLRSLPRGEYDELIAACDVGMIFLDYRFTIPNFPSRLLGYMQARLPVLAVTDPNTDIGSVIVDGRFGWHLPANDARGFADKLEEIVSADLKDMGERSFCYLKNNCSLERSCRTIERLFHADRSQ